MNAIQKKKVHTEKPVPGCLGRMVNLFDLSSGVTGNRLLTDRPHDNGSSLSRSQSDVGSMLSPPFRDPIEGKQVLSELSRTAYNKTNATPMKMLIAEELSKEGDAAKHKPPNVVARLMGLDTLPRQQSDSAAVRSHSKGYSRRSLSQSSIPSECWQQDDGFSDMGMHSEYMGQNECRDVYEIWQQSQKPNYVRDKSPQKINYCENINEKKMALVREKFMEAKRLATDEKLHQSKEFQEALEVLSSNKELFLKFLQEPNSVFSQHFSDMQSVPPSQTKRITVLRPAKVVDREKLAGSGKKSDEQVKKPAHAGQVTGWDKSSIDYSSTFSNQNAEVHPTQSTRIVVLKPTAGKTHDFKAVVSPPSPPPRILVGEDVLDEPEDEARESREVAKEITRQMRENMMGHRRDETLLSSVLSNGYIGDESSFDKSENEYAVDDLSDSEVLSPTSRHSWDYLNRFGSPYSSSSFSHASCSPESSVCREAKKRLSERWAVMSSNGSYQEQRHVRRSSSTLGEMLALSDSKKFIKSEDVNTKEQKPRVSTSMLSTNVYKEECGDDSPINLLRSKSLPVSSTVYCAGQKIESSDPEIGKSLVPKELTKAKSMTSSLKVKVSSLFFSRTKRLNKEERSSASQSKDESQSYATEVAGSPAYPLVIGASTLNNDGDLEECPSAGPCSKASPDLVRIGQIQNIVFQEAENVNVNQDQPSPVSVLDLPFEEDDNAAVVSPGCIKRDEQGKHGSIHHPIKSNLIDKSPPIESIARTLLWDDSCTETASLATAGAMEEEQEWLASIQTLLSEAGLGSEVQSNTLVARGHSPGNPLDSSFRDKYSNMIEEPMHEGKRRQRRSSRKLVFDCVNAALVEIKGNGWDNSSVGRPWSGLHNRVVEGGGTGTSVMLADRVWAGIKEWIYREDGCGCSDDGDMNSLVVDRVVRKELVGNWWAEHVRLHVDSVGKEIEVKLLEELMEEAVLDLTGRL